MHHGLVGIDVSIQAFLIVRADGNWDHPFGIDRHRTAAERQRVVAHRVIDMGIMEDEGADGFQNLLSGHGTEPVNVGGVHPDGVNRSEGGGGVIVE